MFRPLCKVVLSFDNITLPGAAGCHRGEAKAGAEAGAGAGAEVQADSSRRRRRSSHQGSAQPLVPLGRHLHSSSSSSKLHAPLMQAGLAGSSSSSGVMRSGGLVGTAAGTTAETGMATGNGAEAGAETEEIGFGIGMSRGDMAALAAAETTAGMTTGSRAAGAEMVHMTAGEAAAAAAAVGGSARTGASEIDALHSQGFLQAACEHV